LSFIGIFYPEFLICVDDYRAVKWGIDKAVIPFWKGLNLSLCHCHIFCLSYSAVKCFSK